MSYYDELTTTYTFRLQIVRNDRTIIDVAITATAVPDGIAKAKENIQRMLNEYTPAIKVREPESTRSLETAAPILPEPESQEAPAADCRPDEPEKTAAPHQSITRTAVKKPDGVKGLLRLRCPECGNTFGTFLREYQSEVECKCGRRIDLTAPLEKYRFTCPCCEKETWGITNIEGADISIKCKCDMDVNL